jgi:hypothetical protein
MYPRPPVYFLTHVILGFFGYFYPQILYATLGYQLLQYATNTRFFLFEMKFRPGNSLEHTAIKLAEVGIGYILAIVYNVFHTRN